MSHHFHSGQGYVRPFPKRHRPNVLLQQETGHCQQYFMTKTEASFVASSKSRVMSSHRTMAPKKAHRWLATNHQVSSAAASTGRMRPGLALWEKPMETDRTESNIHWVISSRTSTVVSGRLGSSSCQWQMKLIYFQARVWKEKQTGHMFKSHLRDRNWRVPKRPRLLGTSHTLEADKWTT
jgi:hypothetical protein